MRRQEWLGVLVVAAATAGIIVVGSLPSAGLANAPRPTIAVPALPPAELSIPSLGAKVVATADPQPGQPVKIKLLLQGDPAHAGQIVPLSVALLSASPPDRMARVIQLPLPLTAAQTSMMIGPDGRAEADVELAADWASAAPTTQPDDIAAAANNGRPNGPVPQGVRAIAPTASYSIVLGSTLNGPAQPGPMRRIAALPTTQPEQP
ncbi:MAG: hypothetical protein BIFFINMI_01919 [Phycisphaerae bacterium]|nr:hypothetical protein [Phycisphaerae bacterium]